ncbi:tail fiber protein [uncultured Tenacibaculum sp.]|uniref:phage tail protein n=1 Tax=uncultured Tenacibaculum sp. TaxID=174713 RepID=UPI00260F1441|nr:tail fiber protein [uncultured Tenacibaculum sp.]
MKLKLKFIGLLFICLLSATESKAQEPILGEVRIFAGNFAPRGWAFCDGQLLPISQNSALFSLLGTMYGGDGRTTFGLPDLRGRVAMSAGRHPGSSYNYIQGQRGGLEERSLNILQLPQHSHSVTNGTGLGSHVLLSTDNAVRETPMAGDVPAVGTFTQGISNQSVKTYGPPTNLVNGQPVGGSSSLIINNAGSSQPVDSRQPYLVLRYIIALQGIFPSRS